MIDHERVDELLEFRKYRLTLMALKAVWWELDRIIGKGTKA